MNGKLTRIILFLVLTATIVLSVFLGSCARIIGESSTTTGTSPGLTNISTTSSNLIPASTTDTTTTPGPKDISVADAQDLLERYKGDPYLVLIDVRTPEEYSSGHIDDSLNIDYQSPDFKVEVDKLAKPISYLLYCRTGARSAAAGNMMANLGFKYIFNMIGGITAWQAAGFPVRQ